MVSAVAVAAAVHLGVDLTYIHSHFLQLGVASFIISVLLSVYLYIRSRYVAPEKLALGGNSGGHKYLIRSEGPDLLRLCVIQNVPTFLISYFYSCRQRGLRLFQRARAQSKNQKL